MNSMPVSYLARFYDWQSIQGGSLISVLASIKVTSK